MKKEEQQQQAQRPPLRSPSRPPLRSPSRSPLRYPATGKGKGEQQKQPQQQEPPWRRARLQVADEQVSYEMAMLLRYGTLKDARVMPRNVGTLGSAELAEMLGTTEEVVLRVGDESRNSRGLRRFVVQVDRRGVSWVTAE